MHFFALQIHVRLEDGESNERVLMLWDFNKTAG